MPPANTILSNCSMVLGDLSLACAIKRQMEFRDRRLFVADCNASFVTLRYFWLNNTRSNYGKISPVYKGEEQKNIIY